MRSATILSLVLGLVSFSLTSSANGETAKGEKMSVVEMGFFAIPVLDIDAAKKFYGPVMGWDFNDRDPEFSYIMANGNMIGALEAATDSFKPSATGPLIYFRSDFMSKTLDRVTSNGGIVIEKLAMNGGANGYTAKVSDPFKNTIGFWAPED